MTRFEFKVPATSANLGLGFDSIGLALSKFLYISSVKNDVFKVINLIETTEEIPTDTSNLILKTAIEAARLYDKKMPAIEVTTKNEIPLSRGLGSSSSAVVAGIELANYYCKLNLSDFDKITIGSKIEGHPDNIGPCVTGGLFIGSYVDHKLHYYASSYHNFSYIVSIPRYTVKTSDARKVLPLQYSKKDAVEQGALSNVLVLALIKGDKETIRDIIMSDRFHEKYRSHLIPEFAEVRETALGMDAIGTVISGAGSTILTIVDKSNVQTVLEKLKKSINCDHEEIFVYNRD